MNSMFIGIFIQEVFNTVFLKFKFATLSTDKQYDGVKLKNESKINILNLESKIVWQFALRLQFANESFRMLRVQKLLYDTDLINI